VANEIVVFGLLGSVMDRASKRRGKWENRWDKWRPTVSIAQHDDFPVKKLVLLHNKNEGRLAEEIATDIETISPLTTVERCCVDFNSPWDLSDVFVTLSTFLKFYRFKHNKEDYYFHITTGSHIQQICTYLLTEAHYFPGKLLQTGPDKSRDQTERNSAGQYQIIDLDLSKYDAIAERFHEEHLEGTDYLKSGIETKNKRFNQIISQIETVAVRSQAPMLITGPTGAGKSKLACKIYELKKMRGQVNGLFVEVNCATLRGDNAMSALFGHRKGAFTGALDKRDGLLKKADQGLLFLDEIGELGVDEQAMLLRAVEEKRFFPMGSDTEVKSEFQLIAGTNRDLRKDVITGRFREDLLARINLWTYDLPGLKYRQEDIEPNLDFELVQFERHNGIHVTFNIESRKRYLDFALSSEANWLGNFRDLNASVTRMATLSTGGRINTKIVEDEIENLKYTWGYANTSSGPNIALEDYLDETQIAEMDYIDQVQLKAVIAICQDSRSVADASRKLFNVSRRKKASSNDSHRLGVLLKKYNLSFDALV